MISLFQYVKAVDATAVEPDDWAIFGPHYFRAETQKGTVVLAQDTAHAYVLSLVTGEPGASALADASTPGKTTNAGSSGVSSQGHAHAHTGRTVVSTLVSAEPTQEDLSKVVRFVVGESLLETAKRKPSLTSHDSFEFIQDSSALSSGSSPGMPRSHEHKPPQPPLASSIDPNAPPGFEDEFEIQQRRQDPQGVPRPALGPYGDSDLYPPGGRHPSLGPFAPNVGIGSSGIGGMSPLDPTHHPSPNIRYDPTGPSDTTLLDGSGLQQPTFGQSPQGGGGATRDLQDINGNLGGLGGLGGSRRFGGVNGQNRFGSGNGFSDNFGFGSGGSGNGFI